MTQSKISRYDVQRVRLNKQGYDSQKTYWGIGNPIYYVFDTSDNSEMFLRARNAKHAREVFEAQKGI